MLSAIGRFVIPSSRNKLAATLLSADSTIRLGSDSNCNQFRNYETIAVTRPSKHVAHVELNRPDKANALNKALWREIPECFHELHEDATCRAIVLSGSGKFFCSGIDLSDLGGVVAIQQSDEDIARKCRKMYNMVKEYQESLSSLEKCVKPVIAAIHNGCIGAGVDLICGADIRYCSADAYFQIKEVDVGLAADVGTLQRLPKIVGNESLIRELAFTARKMYSDEALRLGLISRIFPDKTSMIDNALNVAATIAKKAPVAVQGTKLHLIYSRDHTVEEGLEYQRSWNQSMLLSEDLMKSGMAIMSKSEAEFNDY